MSRRTDRSTARVDLSYLKTLEDQQKQDNKGDDNQCLLPAATARRARITEARLQQLRAALSDRDVAILASLKQFRLATTSQLQRLHFANHASADTASRVARRVLARLHDQQLVTRLQRRIGGIRSGSAGQIYTLSPVGHRLLGETTRKRQWEPTEHHVQHTLAITELAVQLRSKGGRRSYVIDRLQAEPQCWRSPTDGPKQILKPDLFVQLTLHDIELSWFIEIDRATESSRVLQSKLATYTSYWRTRAEQQRHGIFPKVLWSAPTIERCQQIADVIAAHDDIEPRLFDIALAEQAIEVLTDFSDDQEPS